MPHPAQFPALPSNPVTEISSQCPPKTIEFLVSVLALSTFFGIDDGIGHTVAQFTCLGKAFHPALQFQLARSYRIDDWIEPAFQELVKTPIESLTIDHVDQIGPHGFFQLVQTKEKLLTVRREMAFHVPPTVNDGACHTPFKCSTAWTREWRENVPQIMHHPDAPSDCVELLHQLRSAIEGICNACQDLSVTWLWGKGWSDREDRVIDEAASALMALQTGAPIRATLSANLRAGAHVELSSG